MEWANYSVVVSNIGTVGTYKTKDEALDVFNYYVELSRHPYTRAFDESVTLFNLGTQDVEIEYIPNVAGEDAE
jgi:hypothetical protein